MSKRKIIEINRDKCTGCGLCIPNCPEGAIQIIDNKARLISDLFCDGLGACIGHCPESAITVIEREAQKYDEKQVMENIIKQGPNTIKAHLKHLKDHGQDEFLNIALETLKAKKIPAPLLDEPGHQAHSCPGMRMMNLTKSKTEKNNNDDLKLDSQLSNWPIQLKLIPPNAPYFKNADLLIAADCSAFSYPNFHNKFLKNKILIIACPKLDDTELYLAKLTQIFRENNIKSITYTHMEVPCCFGLIPVIEEALDASGKKIPFEKINIGINGEIKE